MNSSIVVFVLVMAVFFAMLYTAGATQFVSPIKPKPANDNNGQIAFVSLRDGDAEIYVMNTDGTNQHSVSNHEQDHFPSWSPDGSKIAFTRYLTSTSSNDDDLWPLGEIYVMNADGTNQRRLTNNTVADVYPTWSPDGSKIAFVSDSEDNNDSIYVMNADGTNQHIISNNTALVRYLAWSPDGSKIAFDGISANSDDSGTLQIYVMNADGTNRHNVSKSPGVDLEPSWSPDGSKIAFVSNRDGDEEIYVMNADGSNQNNLSNNAKGSDSSPSWSPDGTRIAFQSNRDFNQQIYVMDADGSNQLRMTEGSNNSWNIDPNWGTH